MTYSLYTNQYDYPVRWDFTPGVSASGSKHVIVRHSRWYASAGWVSVIENCMTVRHARETYTARLSEGLTPA